jgi:hypothetical protein
MNAGINVVLVLVLVVAVAVVFALTRRELRALRRALSAADEAGGRRAATLLAGLRALREPLDAVRAQLDELSPDRRATMERMLSSPPAPASPTSPASPVESTGLRLPRASEDERESDGETRVMLLRAVCRMCEGSGVVRAGSGSLAGCGGCDGAGYVDPSAEPAPGVVGRDAQLPG